MYATKSFFFVWNICIPIGPIIVTTRKSQSERSKLVRIRHVSKRNLKDIRRSFFTRLQLPLPDNSEHQQQGYHTLPIESLRTTEHRSDQYSLLFWKYGCHERYIDEITSWIHPGKRGHCTMCILGTVLVRFEIMVYVPCTWWERCIQLLGCYWTCLKGDEFFVIHWSIWNSQLVAFCFAKESQWFHTFFVCIVDQIDEWLLKLSGTLELYMYLMRETTWIKIWYCCIHEDPESRILVGYSAGYSRYKRTHLVRPAFWISPTRMHSECGVCA